MNRVTALKKYPDPEMYTVFGNRGRLYDVESDYQVAVPEEQYSAMGCGANFALGALGLFHRLNRTGDTAGHFDGRPERIVRDALTIAEQFSAGVRGPFTVLGA